MNIVRGHAHNDRAIPKHYVGVIVANKQLNHSHCTSQTMITRAYIRCVRHKSISPVESTDKVHELRSIARSFG